MSCFVSADFSCLLKTCTCRCGAAGCRTVPRPHAMLAPCGTCWRLHVSPRPFLVARVDTPAQISLFGLDHRRSKGYIALQGHCTGVC